MTAASDRANPWRGGRLPRERPSLHPREGRWPTVRSYLNEMRSSAQNTTAETTSALAAKPVLLRILSTPLTWSAGSPTRRASALGP